jgi:hypothetical protein
VPAQSVDTLIPIGHSDQEEGRLADPLAGTDAEDGDGTATSRRSRSF